MLYFAVNKVRVKKLEPQTVYNFFLAAGNVAGFGKEAKFQVKTAEKEDKNVAAGKQTSSFLFTYSLHLMLLFHLFVTNCIKCESKVYLKLSIFVNLIVFFLYTCSN